MYLAFDLGASSGRAVVGRLREEGRMGMEEVHRFDTPIREREAGLFWNIEALWEELQAGLRAAREAARDLRSLSVDSWAVDYVPLDETGDPLGDPHCYRDERTDGWMGRAFEQVPPEELFATTGIQFLPFNTLYQLLAEREQTPERFENTRGRLLIAGYFLRRFGGRAVAERSMASTTQLMDARSGDWATGLMQRFDLDPEAWPEVVPPATVIGTLQPEDPSAIHNSQSEIQIVAGLSHDTAAAVAAVPGGAADASHATSGHAVSGHAASWAYVSSGTWSLLGAELPAPVLTAEAREAGFTNEAGLGGTTRFLTNLTGLWPLQECAREWREAGAEIGYDQLFAEAAAAGPVEAEIDLEDDRFLPRGGMEKRLNDYCRETGQPVPETRGELARVVLESIAVSYRKGLESLASLAGARPDVLHIVGGGAQNALLCRLAAEATGCRVVAGPVEATALGNLLVQARALGDLPPGTSVREAARRSADTTTYEPDPSTR
jgi:rhamnulokinase